MPTTINRTSSLAGAPSMHCEPSPGSANNPPVTPVQGSNVACLRQPQPFSIKRVAAFYVYFRVFPEKDRTVFFSIIFLRSCSDIGQKVRFN